MLYLLRLCCAPSQKDAASIPNAEKYLTANGCPPFNFKCFIFYGSAARRRKRMPLPSLTRTKKQQHHRNFQRNLQIPKIDNSRNLVADFTILAKIQKAIYFTQLWSLKDRNLLTFNQLQ